MSTNVRLLSPQGADRPLLAAFYLAHAEGRLRQRVQQGGLSLDPRCIHIGAFDAADRLLAVVQMLPAKPLDRSDHWLAFFESHTVPGGAARQLLLFQPVTVGGTPGRQALAELLGEVVALADREDLDTLLLAAAPDEVQPFEQLGFAVYTNGRRGTGTGFMVPMVRLLPAVDDGPSGGVARAWLAGTRTRRQQFIVRDVSRSRGGGLLERLGRRRLL